MAICTNCYTKQEEIPIEDGTLFKCPKCGDIETETEYNPKDDEYTNNA